MSRNCDFSLISAGFYASWSGAQPGREQRGEVPVKRVDILPNFLILSKQRSKTKYEMPLAGKSLLACLVCARRKMFVFPRLLCVAFHSRRFVFLFKVRIFF